MTVKTEREFLIMLLWFDLLGYAAFSHGNLAAETLSKLVSTIQDSANAVSANIMSSIALQVLQSNYF